MNKCERVVFVACTRECLCVFCALFKISYLIFFEVVVTFCRHALFSRVFAVFSFLTFFRLLPIARFWNFTSFVVLWLFVCYSSSNVVKLHNITTLGIYRSFMRLAGGCAPAITKVTYVCFLNILNCILDFYLRTPTQINKWAAFLRDIVVIFAFFKLINLDYFSSMSFFPLHNQVRITDAERGKRETERKRERTVK